MNKLTKSQNEILTDYHSNQYGIPEAWGDVYNALEKHGKKYYIYKSLCKNIGKILENDKKNSFVKWTVRKTLHYLKKLIKIY